MKIPFKYTFRNFKSRKLTAIITVTGIALVVFVFTAALMMAYGVEKTLVATGSNDNVMILRKSSQGEITSIVDGDTQNLIRTLLHVAKSPDGNLLVSPEPVVIINLEIKKGGMSNITVRGVSQMVYQLRPQVKIINGRLFNPSLRELIVGKSVSNKFAGADIDCGYFNTNETVILRIGVEPNQIELSNGLTGLRKEEILRHRVKGKYSGITAYYLGLNEIIKNKALVKNMVYRGRKRGSDSADYETLKLVKHKLLRKKFRK